MTREHKHIIVYGAFGLLLGAKIVEVLLTRSDTGFFDWWLLLIGICAAIVHYLPVNEQAKREQPREGHDEGTPGERPEDTLVLRNHTHLKRTPPPGRHLEPLNARRDGSDDPFV